MLKAVQRLKEEPSDLDARGVILFGASISTSGRLGLGKEENYAYDLYEVEFIPEVLFGSTYRKSLTSLFPGFLKVMAVYHQEDIQKYFKDVFGYDGSISESADRMRELFGQLGIDMYFDGKLFRESVSGVETGSCLSQDELYEILKGCMK